MVGAAVENGRVGEDADARRTDAGPLEPGGRKRGTARGAPRSVMAEAQF